MHALARLHPLTMLVSDERQLAHLPAAPWVRISAPTSIREPFVARQVNRLAPDVVFSPMQTMGTWGRRSPVLLTLHDHYYRHRTPPEFAALIRLLWRLYHLACGQRPLLNRPTPSSDLDVRCAHRDPPADPQAGERGAERGRSARPDAPAAHARPGLRGTFMPYKNVEALARQAALPPDHELHLISRVSADDRARLTAPGPAPGSSSTTALSTPPTVTSLRGATALARVARRGLRAAAGGGHERARRWW